MLHEISNEICFISKFIASKHFQWKFSFNLTSNICCDLQFVRHSRSQNWIFEFFLSLPFISTNLNEFYCMRSEKTEVALIFSHWRWAQILTNVMNRSHSYIILLWLAETPNIMQSERSRKKQLHEQLVDFFLFEFYSEYIRICSNPFCSIHELVFYSVLFNRIVSFSYTLNNTWKAFHGRIANAIGNRIAFVCWK